MNCQGGSRGRPGEGPEGPARVELARGASLVSLVPLGLPSLSWPFPGPSWQSIRPPHLGA